MFPASFRMRFADEMTLVFADRLNEARRTGRTAVAALWIRTILDVFVHGLAETVRVMFLGTAQDLRFACRILLRHPTFAAAAVLTLALGTGANVAMFTAVRGVLIDAPPYPDADQLVKMWQTVPRAMPQGFSIGDFEAMHARLRSFTTLAGCGWTTALVRGGGLSEEVATSEVTADFFRVFGTRPILGRGLGDADVASGDNLSSCRRLSGNLSSAATAMCSAGPCA